MIPNLFRYGMLPAPSVVALSYTITRRSTITVTGDEHGSSQVFMTSEPTDCLTYL
jgi:hypothetical protein